VGRNGLERSLGGRHKQLWALKKYIQRLRSKLGDNARQQIWITSTYGVGYHLIGPDSASPALAESPSAGQKH
jgi:DNA-binding response OmpR family regulator